MPLFAKFWSQRGQSRYYDSDLEDDSDGEFNPCTNAGDGAAVYTLFLFHVDFCLAARCVMFF